VTGLIILIPRQWQLTGLLPRGVGSTELVEAKIKLKLRMQMSSSSKKFSDADIAETVWVEYRDEKKDRPYFYNKETAITTWKIPPDYLEWRNNEIQKFMNERGIVQQEDDNSYEMVDNNGDIVDCGKLMADFQAFLTSVTVARRKSKRKQAGSKPEDAPVSREATATTSAPTASATTVTAAREEAVAPKEVVRAAKETTTVPEIARKEPEADAELPVRKKILVEKAPSSRMEAPVTTLRATAAAVVPLPAPTPAYSYEHSIKAINTPDSIMNKSIADHIKVAIKFSPQPSEAAAAIVKALCDNYIGYAQMVNWTMEINHLAHDLQSKQQLKKQAQDQHAHHPQASAPPPYDVSTALCGFLVSQIKSKFSTEVADKNMHKYSISAPASNGGSISARQSYHTVMPAWLEAMMDDPLYRKMLIELYDSFKSCQFLGLCLQRMSYKGYHK
jgi:hypothetical protein